MKKFLIIKKIKAATRRLPISIYLHSKINNLAIRKFMDLLLVPFGIVNYFVLCSKKYESVNGIAVVAIVKNEAKYIKEWIDYHRLIGVNKFYIYDNNSSDNLREILSPYISKNIVILHQINGMARQNDAYNDALNRYGKHYKYFIALDIDEFIYLNNSKKNNLFDILQEKINSQGNEVGGISVNWMLFGSAGKKENDGLVTQSFFYRSKDNFKKNKHIKTICNSQKIVGFLNPHYPIYLKEFYSIDTEGNKVEGPFVYPPKYNDIRINHYFTKSKEEFIKKRKRGMADNKNIRNMNDFYEHDKNDVFDDSMKKYKKKL